MDASVFARGVGQELKTVLDILRQRGVGADTALPVPQHRLPARAQGDGLICNGRGWPLGRSFIQGAELSWQRVLPCLRDHRQLHLEWALIETMGSLCLADTTTVQAVAAGAVVIDGIWRIRVSAATASTGHRAWLARPQASEN